MINPWMSDFFLTGARGVHLYSIHVLVHVSTDLSVLRRLLIRVHYVAAGHFPENQEILTNLLQKEKVRKKNQKRKCISMTDPKR